MLFAHLIKDEIIIYNEFHNVIHKYLLINKDNNDIMQNIFQKYKFTLCNYINDHLNNIELITDKFEINISKFSILLNNLSHVNIIGDYIILTKIFHYTIEINMIKQHN